MEKLNSKRHIKYQKIIYLCIATIIAAFVVYIFVSKPYEGNTITTLPQKQKDNKGNTYKPVSCTGVSGHHVLGILIFPKIDNSAKNVILTLPGIDNRNRVFTWNL